jgi:hypothetical protein
MTLRDDLAAGSRGLRWSLPGAFDVTKDEANVTLARDPDCNVAWLIRLFPWPLDLRRAFDDVLRTDLETDVRDLFEAGFQAGDHPFRNGVRLEPRTADPRWSPIIDLEHLRLGDAPSLRLVRRLTYQPGNESLSGSLLVPLARGYVEIAAVARAATTGLRESMLMLKREEGVPGEPKAAFRPQSEYDDPAHDALFADHPLTRVRRALRWLIDDAGIAVLAPATEPTEGETTVEAAGCAVVLPPRFLFVPREVMPMSPTLASYARATLGDASVRLLDVWRHPTRIAGRHRERDLERLATETTAAWTGEGATEIEQQAEIVAGDARHASVRTVVHFSVGPKRKVSAMRWRADEDGTVFRVSASAAPHVSPAELRDQADAVMGSLRRLDVDGPTGAPTGRPWWKLW